MSHLQADQTWGVSYMDLDNYASVLIECGPAFAMADGLAVWGCAGVCEIEPHRATAWALIHEEIGARYFRFHKAVLSFLVGCKYQRVELATRDGDANAERWAKMLGFKWEGCMDRYFPDGGMGNLYARVK